MAKTLQVGDKASIKKAFTEDDVFTFASLSTDTNPLHLDRKYAANTIFKNRIVHGMLVSSLFSGLIGVVLPGIGSIYLGQNLTFKAPVRIGEQVTATVEIMNIRQDKPIVTLKTICTDSQGNVVIEGEAVVKAAI
jgi:acyl dehydratase